MRRVRHCSSCGERFVIVPSNFMVECCNLCRGSCDNKLPQTKSQNTKQGCPSIDCQPRELLSAETESRPRQQHNDNLDSQALDCSNQSPAASHCWGNNASARTATIDYGSIDSHEAGLSSPDDDVPLDNLLIASTEAGTRLSRHTFYDLPGPQQHDPQLNKDMLTCLVCGASLDHIPSWNGRLNHTKRCSKSHGVTARQIRHDDQWTTAFASSVEDPRSAAQSDSGGTPIQPRQTSVNPYKTTNHGDEHAPDQHVPDDNMLKKRSLSDVLMAGARKKAALARIALKAQTEARDENREVSRMNTYHGASTWMCPTWKKIPGTDFICDGFLYARPTLSQNYFLTHFHSDHYRGLAREWKIGVIYCSLPTANLVHQLLGVDRSFLHPLPMNKKVDIMSNGKLVSVTMLCANHCPGAVMFLFVVGKRHILHVGDFRWNRSMVENPSPLTDYVAGKHRLDDLFLDTTYCNPKYSLPTQEDAIQATIDAVAKEMGNAKRMGERILILFGAYTIGKERMYLSVAEHLGVKVYVDNRRYRILSSLEWPKETLECLTTQKDETSLWVVPLGHINMKQMSSYLSLRRSGLERDFDRVVGVRPTGWALSSKSPNLVKTASRNQLTIHSVPYSEHSSFPELVDCVRCLNPKRIVPTVSTSKSKEQIHLLLNQ